MMWLSLSRSPHHVWSERPLQGVVDVMEGTTVRDKEAQVLSNVWVAEEGDALSW